MFRTSVHDVEQSSKASSTYSTSSEENSSSEWCNGSIKHEFEWPIQYEYLNLSNDFGSISSISNDENSKIVHDYNSFNQRDLLDELIMQEFHEMLDTLLVTGVHRNQLYVNLMKLLELQEQEDQFSRMNSGQLSYKIPRPGVDINNLTPTAVFSVPPNPHSLRVSPFKTPSSNEPIHSTTKVGIKSRVAERASTFKYPLGGKVQNRSIVPKCRADDILQRIDEVNWQLKQLVCERKKMEALVSNKLLESKSSVLGMLKNTRNIDELLRECLQEHTKVARLISLAINSRKISRLNVALKTAFDEFQIAVLAVMELRESNFCKDRKSSKDGGMDGGMMILGQSIRKARTALWAVSVFRK